MNFRREWVDETEAWEIIKPAIHSSMSDDLEAVINEATAAGCLRTRSREMPGYGEIEYNVHDLQKWLRRSPGRPPGSSPLVATDTPVALLARSMWHGGRFEHEIDAIRAAITEFEGNGIAIYAEPMTARRSTEERIRERMRGLSD